MIETTADDLKALHEHHLTAFRAPDAIVLGPRASQAAERYAIQTGIKVLRAATLKRTPRLLKGRVVATLPIRSGPFTTETAAYSVGAVVRYVHDEHPAAVALWTVSHRHVRPGYDRKPAARCPAHRPHPPGATGACIEQDRMCTKDDDHPPPHMDAYGRTWT